VRELASKSGSSAGRIWSVLNEKGCLKKDDLIKSTKLDENDLYTGIGWLAKENKIAIKNEYYVLEDSNLESEVGSHAGMIWKILDIWGDVDLESIKKLSNLNDQQVNSALGWLIREDKIKLNKDNRITLK